MASNYTEHFGLCQWEGTDQVLREEFNENNAKVEAALDAVNAQVSVKKLLEYVVEEAVTQFDVDVSSISFEEFGEIKVVAALQSGEDILMRLNGIAGKEYGFGDYTSTGGGQGSYTNTYMARFSAENGWACGVLISIVPAQGRNVIFRNYCIGCSGGGVSYSCGTSLSANVQWQELNTLNFVGTSSIEAGSRVQIWGMR